MVKHLLVLTMGCRDLEVMFYIQRGSLPTALTSPSHGAGACTHTLIPVTACYRPINSTVRNKSYVLISGWNKHLQKQKGLLCWQWDLTELLLLSPPLQPFSSTTQPHQGRRMKLVGTLLHIFSLGWFTYSSSYYSQSCWNSFLSRRWWKQTRQKGSCFCTEKERQQSL